VPLIALRGNFLRQGGNLAATADGQAARIVERLDTSIKIELPKAAFEPAVDSRIISIAIKGLEAIDRHITLLSFRCSERTVLQNDASAAIVLQRIPVIVGHSLYA
jgi:hypothetical protein